MRELILDFKFFLETLFQPKGTVSQLLFTDNDIFVVDHFYSPSFFNSGTNNVSVDGIVIEPGAMLSWSNIPFAIIDLTVKIKFQDVNETVSNTTKLTNKLIVSYGVKY